jgi:acetyl esterase/lipase
VAATKLLPRKKVSFYRRKGFLWPVGIIVGLIIVVLVAFRVSPWPGSLVIRAAFYDDAMKQSKALQAHTPSTPVAAITNQQYRDNDKAALLDVYFPEGTSDDKRLPVVIWTHGGAWLSGTKNNSAPYFKLLAAQGYTVIAPNYTLAPEKTYPEPLRELNDAYRYIEANATRFHADTDQIILAGDSAGAQLSSQMAAMVTNPAYALDTGIDPVLKPEQLKGVILNCGIYKMEGLTHPDPTLPKLVGWGNDVTVWAYSGTRDLGSPLIRQMSPFYHVTDTFPPAYISGGNADLLTNAQSKPFANELTSLGVSVTTLFYPENHQPALPHEYQFNLDTADGKNALEQTLAFIKAHTR